MPQLVEMGTCAIHGLTPVYRFTDTMRPTLTTGDLCQTCFIEWVKENVTKLQDVKLVQVG